MAKLRKFSVTIELEIEAADDVDTEDVFECFDIAAQDTDTFEDVVVEWATSDERFRSARIVSKTVDVRAGRR